MFQRDTGRNIEAIAPSGGAKILAVCLYRTVLALNHVGVVAPNTVAHRGAGIWPVIRKQNAGAVLLSLMPNNLLAHGFIDSPKQSCICDLSRYPAA